MHSVLQLSGMLGAHLDLRPETIMTMMVMIMMMLMIMMTMKDLILKCLPLLKDLQILNDS